MAFKELDPEDWFCEIERGLKFRREYGMEDYWAKIEALFYNVHPSQLNTPAPNLLMSQGDASLSTLTVPFPSVTVKARMAETVAKAPIVESVSNLLLADTECGEEAEYATLHGFLYGKGILKLGYDSEFGWDPTLDVGGTRSPLGATLSQFSGKGQRIEFSDSIRPGYPWVRAVLPHDIIVPWGLRDLKDSPWIIHRFVRQIDDLQSDPKYERTRNLQPIMSMEDHVKSYTTTLKPFRAGEVVATTNRDSTSKAEYIECWEIHDRRTGKIMVIATGFDKFIRNEPNMLDIEGLPFVDLSFTPRSRSFWTTPDAFYLLQPQAELTDITIQASKQRRISVIKFMYDRNLITPEEMEKAMSADVGVAIEVKGDGRPMSEAIATFQPQGNTLLYQEGENVRRNAREMTGMSRNQAGEYESTGRRTAFEAKVVDDSSRQRMSRRHIGLQRMYKRLIKKMNALCFAFWKSPRTIEILGKDGARQWAEVTGPQLRGEYQYDISFTSASPVDEIGRKQEAIQIFSTLAQDPTVDPVQLRRYLARAFNDPAFSEIFKPGILEGDPNAYVSAQVQQQNLQDVGQGAGNPGQNGGSGQAMPMQGMPPTAGEGSGG